MSDQQFPCFQVWQGADGQARHHVKMISTAHLPAGEVVIRVHWSSLNYKDALAAEAHPGVAGPLPHVPGIDAAGVVLSSEDPRFAVGDEVLVTGYELGAPAWGGWSQQIRVPANWIVPRPAELSLRDTMVLGTAGFTAAQCVRELQLSLVTPDSGPIVVTGATGGVGCWAVRLLSHLGYEVHAVTGKEAEHDRLRDLGAHEVHGRSRLEDNPQRPLLKAEWAGAVDTVGGAVLVSLLKSIQVGGCVAACGLVAGHDLNMTVYPFILRGVKLAGVTSAMCPRPIREEIWEKQNNAWRVALPDSWVHETNLANLPASIQQIRAGQMTGRVVVKLD